MSGFESHLRQPMFESHLRQLIFQLKCDCLCCFYLLFVWPCLLLSSFLLISYQHVYVEVKKNTHYSLFSRIVVLSFQLVCH